MGPIMVIFFGMSLVTVPEAAESLVAHHGVCRYSAYWLAVDSPVMGLAWGVVLLLALPRGFGGWLLGPIWRSGLPLVLPDDFLTGACVCAGADSGLHALGAARRSLRAELLGSAAYLVGGVAGAFAGGVVGTCGASPLRRGLARCCGGGSCAPH